MSTTQDWTTVVIQKSTKQKTAGLNSAQVLQKARVSGIPVVTEKKFGAAENRSAHASSGSMRKLDESTEEFKHETVDASLSRAIATARLARKMSQRDLATAINERAQVVQEYESGRAIPNAQIIAKLEKALGTHLPRAKK